MLLKVLKELDLFEGVRVGLIEWWRVMGGGEEKEERRNSFPFMCLPIPTLSSHECIQKQANAQSKAKDRRG